MDNGVDFFMNGIIEGVFEEMVKLANFFFEGEEFLFILDDETDFGKERLLVCFKEVLEDVRLDVIIFEGYVERLNKAIIVVFVIHRLNR